MDHIGVRLRAIRQRWGYTLREVEERCARLAEKWNTPSYRISASWLDRVEREGRRLSAEKLIVLAAVYSIAGKELLSFSPVGEPSSEPLRHSDGPNSTLLLFEGPLEERARFSIPDCIVQDKVPEDTTLLPSDGHLPNHYRRAILGRHDQTLEPMIRSGSILLINTQRKTIQFRKRWNNEFERPIYFLFSREGYICGWCELDKNAEWLTLLPHPLSQVQVRRWRYRKEIEVIGRVAVVLLRLEDEVAEN